MELKKNELKENFNAGNDFDLNSLDQLLRKIALKETPKDALSPYQTPPNQ